MRSNAYIAASCEDSQVQYLRHTLAHDSSVITTTAACCWDTWTVIQGGFRPSALHSSDGRCQFRGAKETTTNSSGTCARKVECQQILLTVMVNWTFVVISHSLPLGEKPNSWQTTEASLSSHKSKQIVWYPPPLQISTLPLLRSSPM